MEVMMNITQLKQENFEQVTGNQKVIVDFYADWCGPCRAMAPTLESFADDREDVTVAKLDVDANPELAQAFNVRSIPTIVAFKDGEVTERVVGVVDRQRLDELVA